eukprot:m.60567 g.60567  ORF g.60567 m.60567 type:complete len:288 (+) comp22855_c0_seq1:164-1027(+)
MGADGGTIPTRGELVKEKKRPVKMDPKLALDAKWQHCRLSSEPLVPPIVACELGRLYNKTAIIEFLLNKKSQPSDKIELMQHVRGLKDLTELKLTKTPDYVSISNSNHDRGKAQWCCPLSNLEMNGFNGFKFVKGVGTTVSDRALKEVTNAAGEDVNKEDIITINGTPDEIKELWTRMTVRRETDKAKKKAAKLDAAATGFKAPKVKGETKRKHSSTKDEPTQKLAKKMPQINMPDSTFSKLKAIPDKVSDKEGASKTYKSLFSSSVKKKEGDFKSSYTSRTTYSKW